MPSKRQLQLSAKAETVADHLLLAIARDLNRSAVIEPLERVAVLAALARKLDQRIDRYARQAAATGESYGAIGYVLKVSRQAARMRYRPG